ncbi:hypothetical protein LCGC14_2307270 [marine sediment metagenome]|uniref:FCP1 homology domain-containing protein n=1 Tax=marine sediment metagenome TaxID=412755 RepID=A0A0F9CLS9_9ZZZZ
MRLFVDVDDTIVLYKPESENVSGQGNRHPYGLMSDDSLYVFNESLLKFIVAFREKYPESLIIIWSGGGKRYAQRVAEQAGIGHLDLTYLDKDMGTFPLVAEDDIVVDDQELAVAATVSPPDFFDNKDNWGL